MSIRFAHCGYIITIVIICGVWTLKAMMTFTFLEHADSHILSAHNRTLKAMLIFTFVENAASHILSAHKRWK